MTERLHSVLTLLDEGLSLYRQHFLSFVLITASWFVPVAVITGLFIAFGIELDSLTEFLALLLAGIVFFVLLIYLLCGLSRAAINAVEQRPVRYREVMQLSPLRVLGMACYTLVYGFLAQSLSIVLSIVCICPLYLVGAFSIGAMFAVSDSDIASAGVVLLLLVVLAVIYLAGLLLGGATYSGLIYGLQPWVQEHSHFGVAIQRSIELTAYRFWKNLVVWALAALVLAAAGLTVTMTIGVLVPLPLTFIMEEDSEILQAITVSAWLIGFILVLPPLPIWMALLYRRNLASREGTALQAQVDTWWARTVALTEPPQQPEPYTSSPL